MTVTSMSDQRSAWPQAADPTSSARAIRSSAASSSISRLAIWSRWSGVYSAMRVGELMPGDALGDARLVEMLADAAEPERPAGTEDQGGVDVLDLRDDALAEHAVDLVGDRLESVPLDVVQGASGADWLAQIVR